MAFICIGCWELPEDSPQTPGGQHLHRDAGTGVEESNGQGKSGGGVTTPDAPESGQKGTGLGPATVGALLPLPLICGVWGWVKRREMCYIPEGLGTVKRCCSFWVGVRGRIQVPPVPPDKPVWWPLPWLEEEEPSQAAAWLAYLSEHLPGLAWDGGKQTKAQDSHLHPHSPSLCAVPCTQGTSLCSW